VLSECPTDFDKVWSAVKRDYFAAVEARAGFRVDLNDKRWRRLLNSWRMLCAVDHDAAMRLAGGLQEVASAFEHVDDRRREPRPLQVNEFLMHHEPDDSDDDTSSVLTLGGAALQRRISEQFSRL
jgi:hypothetical protein